MPRAQQRKSGKKVRAVLDVGVNYLFHLLAAARVGFDSEYADAYEGAVKSDDIAFLRTHKSKLTFGAGQGGELLDIFLLPAAFALQSKRELAEYYHLIRDGCNRDDFTSFLDTYDAQIRKLKQWAGHPDNAGMREYTRYRDIIDRLMDITVGNYDSYTDTVWPEQKPGLERIATAVNEVHDDHDRIGQWEEATGLTFRFDTYHILLCSAIKNGPDANSLGYDRVVFHHDRPLERILDFISHEIGTHIFMGDIKAIAGSDSFAWLDLYEGFECLAMYYNKLILGKRDLNYDLRDYHVVDYMRIYGDLHRENPEISVKEMLERGVNRFLETRKE